MTTSVPAFRPLGDMVAVVAIAIGDRLDGVWTRRCSDYLVVTFPVPLGLLFIFLASSSLTVWCRKGVAYISPGWLNSQPLARSRGLSPSHMHQFRCVIIPLWSRREIAYSISAFILKTGGHHINHVDFVLRRGVNLNDSIFPLPTDFNSHDLPHLLKLKNTLEFTWTSWKYENFSIGPPSCKEPNSARE